VVAAHTASLPGREAKRLDHPWLGAILGALDDRLRAHYGVFEYSHSPDCLFRINVVASEHTAILADGVQVHAGNKLIELHLWNEQFPPFPENGLTVAWALRVSRSFDASLRELNDYIDANAALNDVVAVRGNMGFGGSARGEQIARLVGHFGFERMAAPPPRSLSQRLHRFGENILISMTVLARNAAALRADTLWRDRALVLLSRQRLQRRYGDRPAAPAS
jgi:hypothetical protein